MKTIFVTRHKGARDWAKLNNLLIDRWETHLDPNVVSPGDTVIGVLPITLAAEVCRIGAHFFELVVPLPSELRGKELTAEQLTFLRAKLVQYHIVEVLESTVTYVMK